MVTARGSTGEISTDDKVVVIRRRGAAAGAGPGVSIEIDELTAVLFREPRPLLQGYLHLVLVDGPEPQFDLYGFPPVRTTVRFSRRGADDFARVRDHLALRLRGIDPNLRQRLEQGQEAADRRARRIIRMALAFTGVISAAMLAGVVASTMG